MKYLPLLWAQLFRKKTRTVLTLLSVVVAFLLFGLLQAVQMAFESGADAADAQAPAHHRALLDHRAAADGATCARSSGCPGVVARGLAPTGSAPSTRTRATPSRCSRSTRRATSTCTRSSPSPPAQREAFAKTRTGAIAGQRLADRYGWKVGQKLPIASEIHAKTDGSLNWEFDLVGILDADDPAVQGNTDMVLINVAYFDEARQIGRGKTGWYIMRIADSSQARGDRRRDRPALRELARRDQDAAREGVRHRLRQADRRHRRPRHAHPDRGVLHHPDPHRQHHGPVDPRAHPRAGRAQDARLLRRHGDGARARRSAAAAGPRRRRSACWAPSALLPALNGSTGGRFPPLFVDAEHVAARRPPSRSGSPLAIGLPPALRVQRLRIVDALAGHR